jgi:DNA-binding beta-propeller fold protein YncE
MSRNRWRLAFFLFLLLAGCQTNSLAKIPEGVTVLAVANTRENTISFFRADSGISVASWNPDFSFSRMLLFSDQNKVLLYGKNQASAHVIDMRSGTLAASWNVGEGIVNAVASSNGQDVYLADKVRGTVRVWTIEGQQTAEIKVGPSPFTLIPDETKHRLYVMDLEDSLMRELDMTKGKIVRTFPVGKSPMGGLLLPDREEIWVGGHGGGDVPEENISVFSLRDGKKLRTIQAPFMPVEFVRYGRDTVFVISHGSNMLRRVDVHSGKVTGELALGANPFGMVSNGQHLYISSYESNQIYVVDPKAMRIESTLHAGKGPIQMFVRKEGRP